MVASCYFNRRRGYPLIPRPSGKHEGLLDHTNFDRTETDILRCSYEQGTLLPLSTSSTSARHPPKRRNCCGTLIDTPNSSRYANYWHSRFIQKFPFLVEMFYWAINLVFYVSVKALSELIFATEGVWKIAEQHAITVLEIEQKSPFRVFFPLREVDVQMWFRTGHQDILTVLNRAYSLIHIPTTVRYLFSDGFVTTPSGIAGLNLRATIPLNLASNLGLVPLVSFAGTIMQRQHMPISPKLAG